MMISIISINNTKRKVSEYVIFYVKELLKISEVYAAVSMEIEKEFEKELLDLNIHVYKYDTYIDANKYKEVLVNQIGYETARHEDFILLTNDSLYGPFYPLREIFSEMSRRNVDFWGLTEHGKINLNNKIIPRFIQSYFIVFNNSILRNIKFWKYWNQLKLFNTYEEATEKFEFQMTCKLHKLGFKSDKYIDTDKWENEDSRFFMSYILFDIFTLVSKMKFPFIPKYVFEISKAEMLSYHNGNDLRKATEFINDNKLYDLNLIYDNIIYQKNMRDIMEALNLYFILHDSKKGNCDINNKCAVFAYLFYEDLLEYSFEKLKEVPEDMDIYIATNSVKKGRIIKERYNEIIVERGIRLIITGGRGRDIASLMVTFSKYMLEYDIFCFVHDKKSNQLNYSTIGKCFNEHLWDNLLCSRNYIKNVISLFEKNPRIGVLCPDIEFYGNYFKTAINSWTICFDKMKKFLEENSINAFIDENRNPISLGSAFWVRTDAIATLLAKEYKYQDFDAEPLAVDGTFSHVIERVIPYVAQHNGYLTAYISNTAMSEAKIMEYEAVLNKTMRAIQNRIMDCSNVVNAINTIK